MWRRSRRILQRTRKFPPSHLWDVHPDKPSSFPQDYNIRTGTKFFADTLARNNGSVILSIGEYNGWYWGLTYVYLFFPIMFVHWAVSFYVRPKQRQQPPLSAVGARIMQISKLFHRNSLFDLLLFTVPCSLQQHMNGWWQNKNVYGLPRIGTLFNLDICNK